MDTHSVCMHVYAHATATLTPKRPASLNLLNGILHTSFQRSVTFGHGGVDSTHAPGMRVLLSAAGLSSGLLHEMESY